MHKKRILIIEDDPELSGEMKELLETEGYIADTVLRGPSGIELLGKNNYDIFLLDFKMEGMTGLEVLKEIRKKNTKAAVFFISGRPELAALLEAEHMTGAVNGIVEKPFDPQLLLEKIKTV